MIRWHGWAGAPASAQIGMLSNGQNSSGSSAAGSESTALLLGWITLCPCQDGAPAAAELEAPLNRGPEPSPDGELALSWGDLDAYDEVENNQVRFCRARSTIPLLTFAHDCTCVV